MEAVMKIPLAAGLFALTTGWAFAAVNLNTATVDELVALPGIGPVKAQAIIDHRTAHGPFKSIEGLKDVKGIGAKRFEKLKPEIIVAGPAPKPAAAAKADPASARGSKGEIVATGAAKRDPAVPRAKP
jgi:competence protein ComEA